ncbi:Cupredoxin superfamily protein [Perilla frutescens var. hirtella]|uniref:Cupredoxin superfamily protein n=1 Tax=Perilla frutescens var. hirtella TaxID=608512 RepID=A0AAD4ITV9_PERFH|nr:Cupredoxin superfamily protein [Perilla frutescens var. hirtella]
MCLMISTSVGSIHKVGDSAGWTTIANVDYYHWALTKSFQLGDVIVFEYNPQFHNVMRVTHAEYKACNASSPISTYTTGNDSITIDTRGHHFFICGVPGHCQAGQKVDINVPRAPSVAPSESGSASPAPALTTEAPAPSNGATTPPLNMHLGWLLLLQLACIVFGLS